MAVIQDLPVELLIRILELMVQDQSFYTLVCEARDSLTSTALVARSWRAPSQELLSSCLEFASQAKTRHRYLSKLQTSANPQLKHVRRLKLEVWNVRSANEQLALLQQHRVDLQELRVYYRKLELEPWRVYFLAGEQASVDQRAPSDN
ncbi:hypothetical protein BCR35DRAFT_122887 [Leucosporidium creatinivorum]|uniref:Uncharacterized protein n=1 Tax=Leucosporidium creatinivorum TaxID=106004 RepID=A0A1Y2EYF5_9BASI|nr:hypothetical protein BCR35DRAFT_122887 [Leucosporidium creatinivorum]